MMVLPDEALLTAAWIVLQAVAADIQSLVSLPVVPLTYHVVAAAAGCTPMMTKPRKVRKKSQVNTLEHDQGITSTTPLGRPYRAPSQQAEMAFVCGSLPNAQDDSRAQLPTTSGAQMSAVRTALPWSAFANAALICSSGKRRDRIAR